MTTGTSLREMLENGETAQVTENEIATPVEGVVESTIEATGDLDVDLNENVVTPSTPATTPQRLGFVDRAEEMGLTLIGEGCFHYIDEFCEVAYRNTYTRGGANIADDFQIPQLAIFTKSLTDDSEWKYVGPISNFYKFVGNGTLVESLRQSLSEFGSPIFNEETFFSSNYSQIRHEMVIQNETDVPSVGGVYPQIILGNSYDGTKASNITFGLFYNNGTDDIRFGFTQKLGKVRQIHMAGSSTTMSSAVGEYVNVFTSNIVDMITENLNNHITAVDVDKSLDLIQKSVGKKRRDVLSEILRSGRETEGVESWSMTSWQLFNVIAKFSTIERNLNAKLLIENAAERVLVVPTQMADAMAIINR